MAFDYMSAGIADAVEKKASTAHNALQAAKAEIERLRVALDKIASSTQEDNLLWWQTEARKALGPTEKLTVNMWHYPRPLGRRVERRGETMKNEFTTVSKAEWKHGLCGFIVCGGTHTITLGGKSWDGNWFVIGCPWFQLRLESDWELTPNS